jgi:hypothetical protein
MTFALRRIIFYSFCLIFFIISLIVIFYASGYQIDWRHFFTPLAIQKTGMIIIYSDPAGANIYLNGQEQEPFTSLLFEKIFPSKKEAIKTPSKIKNLLPGSYDLHVELSGYWPWERRITINPGGITHVLDINLFKKNESTHLLNLPLQSIYLSPNNKKIFLAASGLLFDLKTEISEKISPENQTASSTAAWSTDSSQIIFGKNLLNLKNPLKNLNLEKIIGPDIANVKLNGETDKIYYQYKNALYLFNLGSRADEVLVKEDTILDYTIRGKELYYVVKNGFSTKLKFYSLNDKKISKELNLPFSDGYKLINPGSKFINLYDEKYQTLYLIDPSPAAANPLIETLNSVGKTEWVNDKEFIWANDFEIWVLDFNKNEKRLITRWSEPIGNIIKTKAENYILYSTEKTISVITWSANDEIQVEKLVTMDKIFSPVFDDVEKNLYFMGKSGNDEGLYKINIQ